MRTAVRVGLLSLSVALAGCGLFGKKSSAPDAGGRPFLGAAPAAGANAGGVAATAPAAPTGISGILAGQVLDRFNRRQPGAFIQVVDLSVPQQGGSAKIEVAADGQGYFTIQGLNPSRNYQLIARGKDGEKVLTGTTLAMPPNPRLSIFISDDLTSASTPPIPAAPSIPGKGATEKEDKPAAGIDPPTKAKPEASINSPPPSPPPASVPEPPVDPTKMVADPGGFNRIPAPAVIPGPSNDSTPSIIPAPPTVPVPVPETQPAPIAPNTPMAPTTQLPGAAPPVPYCVLIGRKVDNFALYGLNGQPWEFRRDHTGRLILLDFWYSTCGPCLQAVPHLVELQRQYGSYGLEVVGIAYEKGKVPEQVQKVRGVRGRYNIPYTTLLGGGGPGPCPLQSQFEINMFPTLVLLDETGQIIWRGEGLDARQRLELENEIRKRLGIKGR